MSGRSWIVLALVIVAGGLVWWLRGERDTGADDVIGPVGVSEEALTSADGDEPPPTEVAPEPSEARTAAAEPEPEPETSEASGELASKITELLGRYEVTGRALDPSGGGLAEVEVYASQRPDVVLARTLADGSFRFEARQQRFQLEGRRADWATVRAGVVDRERAEREVRVVLAPAVALAGRVLDPEGRGIDAARLAVTQDWSGLVGFPLPLDDTQPHNLEAATDAEGRFELEAVPRVPGRPLRVTKEGFEPAEVEIPGTARRDLVVQLERPAPEEPSEEPVLFGVVRFPDGSPAEGARVQLYQDHTTSDRDGRFELARPGWVGESLILAAMLEGWQPALFEGLRDLLEAEAGRVGPIELTLPGRALSIRGRLELADGAPAKGWRLRLTDPTVLNESQNPAPTLEAGGETDRGRSKTSREGRFELEGLSDRGYTIQLWHPSSYLSVQSSPVPAGTQDLVLRVPEDAVLAELSGRVTTRGGTPVVGADVSLQFITMRTRTGKSWETPATTRTDEDGRFALRKVPRRHVNVIVSGADIVTKSHEPEGGELDGEPIDFEVERLLRVQLDFSSEAPPPESFQLLDAAGGALMLESRGAGTSSSSTQGRLQEGRSAVVAVSEAAVTLVLQRDFAEYERRPVVLTPGEVNELRP